MKGLPFLAGLILLAAMATGITYAQQPVSDDEVSAVAKKLYCPVCENTPLDVCPTQVCKDWRELIRQQLSEDWTEEQIVDYFVANYGTQVLAQPPTRGFTALIWILPVVGLVGGGVFWWRLLRREQDRRRSAKPPTSQADEPVATGAGAEPPGVSAEMLARIERDIEERF